MAIRTHHATTRSPRYALGPGAELPIARLVLLLLLAIPVAAFLLIKSMASAGPSPEAQQIASINPRTLFSDNAPDFLPPPVAALPPEQDAGPPAPSADDPSADPTETVKVANTGGVGAILRADPPSGRQVAGLRDGQVLKVLERRTVDDSEWVHVKTDSGADGWIFGRLVAPAQ